MIIGHYAASFAAKAVEPRVPLWQYFLAAQLIDFAWAVFVFTGLEKARLVEGFTRSFPFDFYYMPYSHSLVAALAWSALAYLAYRQLFPGYGRRGAAMLSAVVLSHWLADLIVHPHDLSLWPLPAKVGFDLWNLPISAIVVEAALLLGGFLFYAARCGLSARARNALAVAMVVLILILHATFYFRLNPNSITAVVLMVFFGYVAICWLAQLIEKRLQRTA